MKTENKNNNIYNFNHIDKNISSDQLDEITALYKYYHKLFWCHKTAYKDFKFKSLFLNLASISLVVIGTIVGGVTLNPIILGTITGSGVIIGVFQKKKDYESKIEMSKYGFQLFEKVLISLRSSLRGGEYNHIEFIHELKILDGHVSDLTPIIDKYKKQYERIFDV